MRIDSCRTAAPIAVGLCRPERATAGTSLPEGVEIMKRNAAVILLMAIAFSPCLAEGEGTGNTPAPRRVTLQEAVQLALKHNHNIRIAGYAVEEKEQAKAVAKSSYFPSIRNDSSFMHVTDTQLIQIKSGSFGR